MPVSTIPPLRELAPQPKVSASRTATLTPRLASVRAAERPQKPPPTMATSTKSGISDEGAAAGESTVVAQKFFSWMVIGEIAEKILTLTAGNKTIGGVPIKKGRRQSRCRLRTLCFLVCGTCEDYSSSPSRPSRGVRVPKRPSCSLLMPAVKNKVFAGPAVASFPKVRDHKPLMVTRESSGFLTQPMNLWVKPLNAAIQPLRKLPTRMALLNSPKSRVVHTTPQGAFIQGPC